MDFNPRNILVIDFGQIGDVVLSLPALEAIRKRFEDSRLTVLAGETARGVLEMSRIADEIITIDRYELRDGNKLRSIGEVLKIVKQIRQYGFDFVIDLHSLTETNLLGFLSGAKHRLFANRGNRSLDFLSNYRPKPPVQDRTIHKTDDYLRNLIPLGIENAPRIPKIEPLAKDMEFVEAVFEKENLYGYRLAGLGPGAGHPARRWDLDSFAKLAADLSEDQRMKVVVFVGPEENELQAEINKRFSSEIKVFNDFNLNQVAAAFSKLDVFVGNDSGLIHMAAASGVATVLVVLDSGGSKRHRPLGNRMHEIGKPVLNDIKADEVYLLARRLLDE